MYWTVHLQGGPQRVNHAAVAVGKYIYSFGGYCSNDECDMRGKIDIFVLNTDTLRWRKLEYLSSSDAAVPFQRYGHTVVEFQGKIYLLGGRNDLHSSELLHCFDIETRSWSLPPVRGPIPKAVDGHTACIIGNYMYVWGGYEEETEMFSEVLHRINLLTFTWEDVIPSGTAPERTDFHTASAVGDRMYIFGGRGTLDRETQRIEKYCNKIVYLDTTNMSWVAPDVTGRSPCGRRSHSAVVYDNEIYILYGYNSMMQKHFSDISRFNTKTNRWTTIKSKGDSPCARRRQCCCMIGDKLFLFGGSSPNSDENEVDAMDSMQDSELDEINNLSDHADLFVLDFFPTMRTLCLLKVISFHLDFPWLPSIIKKEIGYMTTDNFSSLKSIYPRRDVSYTATSA